MRLAFTSLELTVVEGIWPSTEAEVCVPGHNGIALGGGVAGMFNDCVVLMPRDYALDLKCPRGEARIAPNFH